MAATPTAQQALAAKDAAPSLETAHAELLADRSLQFQLETFAPPQPPRWIEPLYEFFRGLAPFIGYVFWAGVALIVALILYVLVTEILRRLPQRSRDATTPAPPKPVYQPRAARAKALLEEADRLASEGRFSEAVHVLLLRSIEDIERAFDLAIGPGLTSREITGLDPLSAQGRDVFAGIARAVETSFFGGAPLGADDFTRCRDAYASFALQGARR